MKFLNDLSLIGMALGLIIISIGLYIYSTEVINSTMFTSGIGLIFISLIIYMGTER